MQTRQSFGERRCARHKTGAAWIYFLRVAVDCVFAVRPANVVMPLIRSVNDRGRGNKFASQSTFVIVETAAIDGLTDHRLYRTGRGRFLHPLMPEFHPSFRKM